MLFQKHKYYHSTLQSLFVLSFLNFSSFNNKREIRNRLDTIVIARPEVFLNFLRRKFLKMSVP